MAEAARTADARGASAATTQARLARARDWFAARGRRPFDFQEDLWRAYWRGESGLLNAGTGTGKTLAAWLGPLLESSEQERPGVRVLWVTPLRALARDLCAALAESAAALAPHWRVEVRTGDTSSALRAKQKKRPPQALVTTPESLSVLLSHADFAAALAAVDALVVDEWHEFLGSKRGVLLELLAARLKTLSPGLRVWGISATLPDLDGAMRTLLGPAGRGRLVRSTLSKRLVVDALIPATMARFPWAGHLGLALLPEVLARLERARTALVFTNTRSQAELWYQAIVTARLDWLTSTALHHGAIDTAVRARVEQGLKDGRLRCVVCTSSLDLGVDFPPVDTVLQIGSPKGIARLLQRAGRSGHRPGETSRITVVPTHALELLEAAAARRAAERGALEPRPGLTLALDVLAQHLVTLATGGGFEADAMLREVRGTSAFASLDDGEWRWTLDFITRGGAALAAYPRFRRVSEADGLHRVTDADIARRHRLAIGTITSNASLAVRFVRGGDLGFVEESFVARLKPGDAFIFGGRTLELVRVRDSVVYVRAAAKRTRFVPRWQGTRLPLSAALGGELLELLGEYAAGRRSAPELSALAPLLEVQAAWSAVPTAASLLIEAHQSREGHHLFIYPFAGRIQNEGIAALLAARAARERPHTCSITTNEYGFEILSAEPLSTREEDLRRWLSPENLAADLAASVDLSDLSRRQFRDIARIAGLVDPGMPGRGKSTRQLQASSALMYDVLAAHDAGNLLLSQSRREVLEAQLEHRELAAALGRLRQRAFTIRTPGRLTPLSFPLWADRLQTQTLSTETWQTRIEREARRLEVLSDSAGRRR